MTKKTYICYICHGHEMITKMTKNTKKTKWQKWQNSETGPENYWTVQCWHVRYGNITFWWILFVEVRTFSLRDKSFSHRLRKCYHEWNTWCSFAETIMVTISQTRYRCTAMPWWRISCLPSLQNSAWRKHGPGCICAAQFVIFVKCHGNYKNNKNYKTTKMTNNMSLSHLSLRGQNWQKPKFC